MTTRLCSSGMRRSKLRSPASTWTQRNLEGVGCQRAAESRVGIALDDHDRRALRRELLLEAQHKLADLLRSAPPPDGQHDIRWRQAQILEEDVETTTRRSAVPRRSYGLSRRAAR